jgi:hypothetical protein
MKKSNYTIIKQSYRQYRKTDTISSSFWTAVPLPLLSWAGLPLDKRLGLDESKHVPKPT